ncbi:hypothetical protein NSQ20_12450 [Paenibacillus sp. FSL K6-1122]|uniref:hypothetical protein n=1 Tax=Paenibacillus sp. FSL K6-1122 TaxID=2954512 RepID=UPI0030EEFA82
MAIEAHHCNVKDCKGFIVFENADFDKPEVVDGMYQYTAPRCTECGKEYKVVPHYIVISLDEYGDMEHVETACITEYERRAKERKIEEETDPWERVRKFIEFSGYTYSVNDVIYAYADYRQEPQYLSHSMKDCIDNLKESLDKLVPFGM